MPEYPLIDAHIHTYRTAEMGRQAQQGAGRSGHDGTVEEYLSLMAQGGIEKAVMVNMTPVGEMRDALVSRGLSEEEASSEAIERLRRRNAWTCEVARQHRDLLAYISLDPSMGEEGVVAELQARVKEGARGIKLHPRAQRFLLTDERLAPVFAIAAERRVPILIHGGRGLPPIAEDLAQLLVAYLS